MIYLCLFSRDASCSLNLISMIFYRCTCLCLHDELHARLTSNLAFGSSQTVIFDHEITNVGHAYNSGTGHFTAPYDGIYYCSSTFLKTDGAVPLHLQIVRNKGNNKITELRTILQRESQNS